MNPLHIENNKNNKIETVQMDGFKVSLLAASNDGTEIIKHQLDEKSHWGITTQEGWDALEFLQIQKGKLILTQSNKELTLLPGDFYYVNPASESLLFVAEEDTEFLYVSSKPVFHLYSDVVQNLQKFAIDVEKIDGYTSEHCRRIMKLSMKVGKALGLDYYNLHLLNYASFLHDIGKVEVPKYILHKPGKLTDEEWTIMKKHTTAGKELLYKYKYVNPMFKQIGDIVEQHHERYDGKGYPLSLSGDNIDIKAAIITVVDSFDAMTSDRVYQKARSMEEAIAEIKRCSGSMYHPKVVDAFLAIINEEEGGESK